MSVMVVIPTYNEATNLESLIPSLFQILPKAFVCIVDDHSPDGTATVVKKWQKYHDRLLLIERKTKQGLGKAYEEAFHTLLQNPDYEIFIQMDADFSHPPELILKLHSLIQEGYDFVLASRYVKGGSVRHWAWHRRLLSRWANRFLKWHLGGPWNDWTSGYKAYRKDLLKKICQTPFESTGYVFQIETLLRLSHKNFKGIEIPFIFEERREGKSKISFSILWEAFVKVLRLTHKSAV